MHFSLRKTLNPLFPMFYFKLAGSCYYMKRTVDLRNRSMMDRTLHQTFLMGWLRNPSPKDWSRLAHIHISPGLLMFHIDQTPQLGIHLIGSFPFDVFWFFPHLRLRWPDHVITSAFLWLRRLPHLPFNCWLQSADHITSPLIFDCDPLMHLLPSIWPTDRWSIFDRIENCHRARLFVRPDLRSPDLIFIVNLCGSSRIWRSRLFSNPIRLF